MDQSIVKLIRGDTWVRTWALRDSGGSPINLTGASVRLMVRGYETDAVFIDASTSNAMITISASDGRIDMVVPYSITESLTPGKYKFDIEVTYSNGIRRTIERGVLRVIEDVTR